MGKQEKAVTIHVGDRIESDGFYATVRYVGHLTTDESVSSKIKDVVWIGVEWDDAGRGKHDGSYGGVTYFATSQPTSGSFLRPEKCNPGVGFTAALTARYGLDAGDDAALDVDSMYVRGRNQQTAVTAVGLEDVARRQSCFSELRAVGLRAMFVREAEHTAHGAVNVTELDLSLNLLNSWIEVAKIALHMPHLASLNVSENHLQFPSESDDIGLSFTAVNTLYINRMGYSWNDVSNCAKMFPALKLLHACYNRIQQIRIDPGMSFSQILLVNLEGNPISEWNEVLQLGSLPCLETLIVNDCLLSDIRFPDVQVSPTTYFPALVSLSVFGNQIGTWTSVNELNRLRSLTSLRFSRNPLCIQAGASTARHVAIAKIGKLQSCNGTPVMYGERRGAELDYLRVFGPAWKAAGGKADVAEAHVSADFIGEHPRYLELVRIYGAPEDSEMARPQTSALKNSLVTVQIRTTDHPPLVRKLPVKMTVQKLRALIQRTYRVTDLSSIKLGYIVPHADVTGMATDTVDGAEQTDSGRSSEDIQGVDELATRIEFDNDLRELCFYSVEDGAIIQADW